MAPADSSRGMAQELVEPRTDVGARVDPELGIGMRGESVVRRELDRDLPGQPPRTQTIMSIATDRSAGHRARAKFSPTKRPGASGVRDGAPRPRQSGPLAAGWRLVRTGRLRGSVMTA